MKISKKFYFIPLLFLLVVGFTTYALFRLGSFPIHAFGGGDGSQGSPYQITSCTDFQAVSSNTSAYYIVSNDFSCSGVTNWSQIDSFTGEIDGNDKTISDITSTDATGIFRWIDGGVIKDLNVSSISITSSGDQIGTLAGGAGGRATITNVHILSGAVTGNDQTGGLIGHQEPDVTITGSSSAVSVTGHSFVGGLVGQAKGAVSGCWASGYVYSTGVAVGGLLGSSDAAVSDSHATGDVMEATPSAADQWGTGGLIGYSSGGISNSYATGDVDSYWEAGGLVGYIDNSNPITNSYATGNVGSNITTGIRMGGLAGASVVNVSNSFARGSVTGSDQVGGFSGWANSTISNSYSTGAVTGSTTVGAFVGNVNGTASNSYYNSETAGHSDSIATGKTTAEMKLQSTYTGWDFDTIWSIDSGVNDGYPVNYPLEGTSSNATVVSSVYTVSTGGTANETITNVTYNTSKAAFLSNLSKGNANQTWDDSGISDPVITNDTLVVTAQDGVTIVTYTVTVNAEQSHIATISSSAYTISAGGTSNETIRGVTSNTSKATFLANITKDDPNETFNTDNLGDPVTYGDTLVVTAEDGTTQVTYTIAVPLFSGSGEGTSESPYQVSSCTQLQEIQNYSSSYFALSQNIDCADTANWNDGAGFMPIALFTGTLEGNFHTINALQVDKQTSGGSYLGLFGTLNGATVQNLYFYNPFIYGDSSSQNIGTLAGLAIGGTHINNVHVLGDSGSLGGGNKYVGGLVGQLNYTGQSSTIDHSSSSTGVYVSASGATDIGGLVGNVTGGVITNSSESGDVQANGTGSSHIGGLVGYLNGGTIQKSYTTGGVYGDNFVGGFLGQANPGPTAVVLQNLYSTGDVTETGARDGGPMGGFIGTLASATLSDCYSTGLIDSGDPASGVTGGFLGNNQGGTVTSSYWDTETSGIATSNGGTGLTTSQMKDSSNYADWDFSTVWNIDSTRNNGYPTNLSNVSTISTSTYTVTNYSTFGGNKELITGIPNGTSKTTFLSALTKDDTNEVFVISNLSDVITAGDSLTVVADDGLTITTYMIPTPISTCTQLQDINNDLSGGYILSGNIDCNGESWTPIGTDPSSAFEGILEGNNKTISNISLTSREGFGGGVFAAIEGGIVSNLTLTNITINLPTAGQVGGLVGGVGMSDQGTHSVIYNVHLTSGTVAGSSWVGGLAGALYYNDSIINSSSAANVTVGSMGGGLVGASYGTITNSHASGTVTSTGGYIGGLIGVQWQESGVDTIVSGSYATGSVTGSQYVGGLVGASNSVITDSYATGSATGTSSYVGGLVGEMDGDDTGKSLFNLHAEGNVSGTNRVGGLFGGSWDFENIYNVYATGSVTATAGESGGLIGYDDDNGVISNSYATGAVTDHSTSGYIGGLIGKTGSFNNDLIINVYATGVVTSGGPNTGGLLGYSGTSIENSYATGAVNTADASTVGGLAGVVYGHVSNSYALGDVTATGDNIQYIGGLLGEHFSDVSHCFAQGDVTASGASVSGIGGLIGEYHGDSTINRLYAKGTVYAPHGTNVGGLIGYFTGDALATSYYAGDITGDTNVGGLVGKNTAGTINNSYAVGTVTGSSAVGGLAGDIMVSITNSYAASSITGTTSLGGLVGKIEDPSNYTSGGFAITSSYYDTDISGMTDTGKGVGKTTTEMQTLGTFVDWDFDTVWNINQNTNSGYPYNYEFSGVATVTSEVYTVSTNGTGSETISGISEGTPLLTFLGNIQKDSALAVYNLDTMSDPVENGDQLVVTAEDGETQITYTLNVPHTVSTTATVTSSTYTVSTTGSTGTISGITEGTSKTTLLSNIQKGEDSQTWNADNIANPVVTGNTLVVTAEDGVTVVTYTLEVAHTISTVAIVTSSTYTVNTTGSTGTITNVPANTSKTTLIANIQKGNSAQTWNTNNIANPVVTGNTLVVTAEDGTTVVTYTITVNENTDGREDLAPTRMYYSGPNNWGVQNTKFTVSGDFNNDGKDDVAAMYDYGNGKMGIWVFQSNGTSMTPVSMYMGVDGGWNVSATRYVVSGDFNNDGKEDIAAMYDYGNGFMGIWAFLSDGTHLTPTRIYTGVPGGWNVSATKFVVSGDFNNDGKEDIGAMYDYGNGFMGIWAFESDGTNLSPVRIYTGVPGGWNVSATRYVVSGDFNNDGKEDIAAMYDYGGGFMGIWAFESDGTNLSPVRIYTGVPGGWNVSATKFVVSGDFNNDGKEDIGAMYDYGNGFMGIWAFESDGTNLSPVRIYTGVPGGWNVDATTFLVSGDFDGDTYTDVGAMYNYGSNNMGIWTFR